MQYLIVYFHRVAPAVVASDLMAAFSISGASLGILASAYFYSYGIMQIPVGVLSDSWGPKKTITLFSAVTAIGSLLFGLAPGFGTAILGRIFVGLGVSAIFVAGMRVFAMWFRAGEYGRISSAYMALGGLGWFAATVPLAYLAGIFGWRSCFIVVGIAGIGLSLVTWVVVADHPEQKGYAPVIDDDYLTGEGRQSVNRSIMLVLKERHFWAIAIWFIFRGGALFGFFGLWAGPYLVDVYRLSPGTTGNVLSMIAFAMIFFSPILGHLSDKTLNSRKQVLVGTSILNSVCFLLMALYYDRMSLPWLYLLFFVMGITISSVGTLAIAATKEIFPLDIAGTAMGMINIFPFIGGVLFQPLMGLVLDRAGKVGGAYPPAAYQTIIWIFFVTSVVALISIFFCKETLKKPVMGDQ
jgi:sugar phosphate permease